MILSVVIPVYRQPRCLDLTLGSLGAQTLGRDAFEVIVVDDDSGDDTAAIVDAHRDRLDITLLTQQVNRGRAAARNRGAAAAKGDRIVFLDADSFADPGLLAAHHRFHEAHPGKVLLGARVEGDWGAATGRPITGAGRGPGEDMRYRMGLDPDRFPHSRVPWIFGYTHNMSLPSAHFHACGGFDETFSGWGHEDLELAYRLHVAAGRSTGYFRFDPDALCYHLPHFRRNQDNWAQAERMVPYVTAKHRSLEMEFFEDGPLVVLDTLPLYLDRLRSLHDFKGRDGHDEIAAALPPAAEPGRLVLGVDLDAPAWRHALIERVDHRPPGPAVAPGLVGMRLPYGDDRFADVVNIDLWRILTPDHLSRLIVEGLRVARVVYLGCSAGVPGAAENGLVTEMTYVRDMLAAHCATELIPTGPRTVLLRAKRR
jgi:glycosyltransferase involved in cell wall biosynthesis